MSNIRFSTILWSLTIAIRLNAQAPTTTSLSATPTSSTLSQAVTLTAIISPVPPTGDRVTFYDGTTILGVSLVDATGTAILTTGFLPSGMRSLLARYWGDRNLGGSASNVVQVMVTALKGSTFTRGPSSLSVGLPPGSRSIEPTTGLPAVGDFNNDGTLDLAVITAQGLTVWLGDGNGGFTEAPRSDFEKTISGAAIAVGDFDGDGNLDVAIPDGLTHVTVLLGDGSGGFMQAPGSPFPAGPFPYQAVVADFNGDGKPDIAVDNEYAGTVSVFLGKGNGEFSPATAIPFASAGSISFGMVQGDFNVDGLADIAVVSYGEPGSIVILLNDGNGGFKPPVSYPVGDSPYNLALGDHNGDGTVDLAVANYDSRDVTIWRANSDGTFKSAPGSPVSMGSKPSNLAFGDFNGDGKLDLAVANSGSNDVSIMLGGDGQGGFTTASIYPVGSYPLVTVGDFNRDGLLDFATMNFDDNTVSVMLNTTGLTVLLSQSGGFAVNQIGTYTLTVSNSPTTPSNVAVTVTDALPPGLNPQTATGPGWDCLISGQTVTCTRHDALAAAASYPPITLTVLVVGSACPNVSNTANVTTVGTTARVSSSAPARISGCVTVAQTTGVLAVNTSGIYVLTMTPAPGATLTGGLTVTDTLPVGVIPTGAAGTGWNCMYNSTTQAVTCTWPPTPPPAAGYPPITISVLPHVAACPSTSNLVQIQLDNAQTDFFGDNVTIHGCLIVPPTMNLPNAVVGQKSTFWLMVTSIDNSELIFYVDAPDGQFRPASCQIDPRKTCTLPLTFDPCLGQNTVLVNITTDAGSVYQLTLNEVGVVGTVSFLLDGNPLPVSSNVNPKETHTLTLKLSDVPNPACGQQPIITASFIPSAPDGSIFDATLSNTTPQHDGTLTSTLETGSVAGAIRLVAQIVPSQNITTIDNSGIVMLMIPQLPGFVQAVTLSNKTSSSFEIGVTGYSTPRDAINPTTQVCFSFSPASGARVQTPTPPTCALQQEIKIWYQQPMSIKTGSEFDGHVTVSFSGDASAIGQIKVWIINLVEGMTVDSQSVCVDFQSLDTEVCK
jgi:uncharacterized repeat protein (TIGR01451 family)